HYPMYAQVHGPLFQRTLVYGVTSDGEIELPASEYWQPFDADRLTFALTRTNDSPDADRRFGEAFVYFRTRYEVLRSTTRPELPRLHGLRIYKLEWEMDRQVSNLGQPRSKELVSEVKFPDRLE